MMYSVIPYIKYFIMQYTTVKNTEALIDACKEVDLEETQRY